MLGAIFSVTRSFAKYTLLVSAMTATAAAAPSKSPAAKPAAGASESPDANAAADTAGTQEALDLPDNATVGTAPIGSRREGDYGGVKPGAAPTGDGRRSAKQVPRKGALSWIGFEPKGGGADVFLQSAGAFEVAQRVEAGVLVVRLSGLSQLGHNTWRFIDTRFFETPIAQIVAKRTGGRGAGIEVRIRFKRTSDAREAAIRTATEADGLYYAYLTFPG